MITLLIIGSFHALYLSIIVIAKRNKVTPDYLLSAFLFIIFIVFATLYSSFKNNNPDLQLYLIDISILLAPLFFLYIKTITDPDYKFKWQYLIHFIPYIISSSYYEYIFNTLPITEIDWLVTDSRDFFKKPIHYVFFQLLEHAIIPFYLVWSYILLKRHKKEIIKRYSFYKGVDYKWLKKFVLIFGSIWLTTNGFMLLNANFLFIDEGEIILLGFSISTILIFYLGYLGLKQNAVFSREGITKKTPSDSGKIESPKTEVKKKYKEKYKKTGLSKDDAINYKTQLLYYVKEKKPYLNSTVSLNIIAQDFGIASHHLSQVINDQFGDNFYDFINKYRVEEFKTRIEKSEHKQYNLLSLALECGFNSKSAFNRVFKKLTDQTPSEYIKYIEQNT